jgi:hypothetical protein
LAAVFLASFLFTWRFFEADDLRKTFLHPEVGLTMILAVIWLVIHLIINCCRSCSKKRQRGGRPDIKYEEIAYAVSLYYLGGLVEGIDRKGFTRQDLEAYVGEFQEQASLSPDREKISKCRVFLRLVAASGLIVIGLICVGVIKAKVFRMPALVSLLVPYIVFPIALIILVLMFLTCCDCGRRRLVRAKTFLMKWGLRILLLILDVCYIPTIQMALGLIIWTSREQCEGGGMYMYANDTLSQSFRMVSEHLPAPQACVACVMNCSNWCDGGKKAWLREELSDDEVGIPNLRYVDDVVYIAGFMLLFAVGCIMIGVPILWGKVIAENTDYLWSIKVYGSSADSKWRALLNRLTTNGIGLFVDYRFTERRWSIILIGFKFVAMLIVALAGYATKYMLFLSPVAYVLFLILTIKKKPYLYNINNVLDVTLWALQALFAIFPILGMFNVAVPVNVVTGFSIALAAVPIIGMISLFCCRSDKERFEEADPTIKQKFEEAEIEARTEKMRKMMSEQIERKVASRALPRRPGPGELAQVIEGPKFDAKKTVECFDELAVEYRDDPAALEEERKKRKKGTDEVGDNEGDKEEDGGQAFGKHKKRWEKLRQAVQVECFREEDEVHFDPLLLMTIDETLKYQKEHPDAEFGPPKGGDQMELEEYNSAMRPHKAINRHELAATCDAMFKHLDAVVDAHTLSRVSNVLKGMLIFGFFGLGWWAGGCLGRDNQLVASLKGLNTCLGE